MDYSYLKSWTLTARTKELLMELAKARDEEMALPKEKLPSL